jgi:D-3-phosphoglycerate dehydrogenase
MKVLIADRFEDRGIEELAHRGCQVFYEPGLDGDALHDAVARTGCDALVVRSTRVTDEVLGASPNLSLVIRAGSGYDTIDVDAATRRDVRVCNCPGMNSVAVAELTLGLMIALDRRIVDETDDLRQGIWKKKEYGKARGLKGRTLGVVGLGRIGYEVAKRAKAFDMNLIYADVIAHDNAECELGIRRVTLDDLLTQSDFVTLHVPGGSDTKHLIGRKQLAMMKPTAFLLNCSRGGIVDEAALAEALSAGAIAGAALDVYEVEPAATDTRFADPIGNAPHLYGTHHVGASTAQAQTAVAEEAVRIIDHYMKSGELLHCVNPRPPGVAAV